MFWVGVALGTDICVCVLEVEGVGDECGLLVDSFDDEEEGGVEAGVAVMGGCSSVGSSSRSRRHWYEVN